MAGGARVPGTSYELDPVQAAFNIGAMIRWLDFNDTWLAAEWGHPSDNLGGILAVADYCARRARDAGQAPPAVRDVLTAMIKAHEIQGVLALENSFNRVGLDHVLLVRVASTAVVARLLGGERRAGRERRLATPGSTAGRCALTAMRPTPARARAGPQAMPPAARCGSRSSRSPARWATRRRCRAKTWGFSDVLFQGKPLVAAAALRQLRHGERAVQDLLPGRVPRADRGRGGDAPAPAGDGRAGATIERIVIETQEPGVRIIDKTGPLANPADRDHCIQYMVAIPLIFGRLTAADYEDDVAADPRIDALRARMQVRENPHVHQEYYAADKRYIGNALQVFFRDGSAHRARAGRFPDRPPQATRRGHAGAGEEVRGFSRCALTIRSRPAHQGAVRRPPPAR